MDGLSIIKSDRERTIPFYVKMSVWSLETVDLENDTPTSSSDILQSSPYDSEDDDDNGPCDSTTTRNFDRLMSWLELSIPDRKTYGTEEVPLGEEFPDQSCWVHQQQNQQEQQQEEQQQEEQQQEQQHPQQQERQLIDDLLMELVES